MSSKWGLFSFKKSFLAVYLESKYSDGSIFQIFWCLTLKECHKILSKSMLLNFQLLSHFISLLFSIKFKRNDFRSSNFKSWDVSKNVLPKRCQTVRDTKTPKMSRRFDSSSHLGGYHSPERMDALRKLFQLPSKDKLKRKKVSNFVESTMLIFRKAQKKVQNRYRQSCPENEAWRLNWNLKREFNTKGEFLIFNSESDYRKLSDSLRLIRIERIDGKVHSPRRSSICLILEVKNFRNNSVYRQLMSCSFPASFWAATLRRIVFQ